MTSAPGPARIAFGRLPPAGLMRLLTVVGGGLVVLQSSPGLGLPKLIYLAVAGAAFLASCHAVWKLRSDRRPMFDAGRPWLIVSLVLFGLIALSLPVALAHGTPVTAWLRDASTYGLFAAAPVFALDAAASTRRGPLLTIIGVVGALGAVSFATNWISIRNLAILPFNQFVLPTSSLPIALLAVSLAAAIVDRQRRVAWVALGGATLGAFLVTGTRSTLLLLVALPVVVLVAGRPHLRGSVAASLGVGLIGLAITFAVQTAFVSAGRGVPIDAPPPASSALPPATASPEAHSPIASPPAQSPVASPPAQSPVASVAPTASRRPPPNPNANILQRLQEFLASPDRDWSLRERVAQYVVAWDLFAANPMLGVGLGHSFVWTRYDGSLYSDFTADTPLVLPAKLGILGVIWVLLVSIVWFDFIRRLRRRAGVTIGGLAMATWGALIVIFTWGGFSVEDKGFSFAVMLLLALGFIEIESGAASADGGPSVSSA